MKYKAKQENDRQKLHHSKRINDLEKHQRHTPGKQLMTMMILRALKSQSRIPCTTAEECSLLGSRICYQMRKAALLATFESLPHCSQKQQDILYTVPGPRWIEEEDPLVLHLIS